MTYDDRDRATDDGTASLELDNTDGQLDYQMPGSIAASAGMESRIRVYATRPTAGTDEIFNGYMVDGFRLTTEGLSHDATATVDLVDWLGWAANQPLPYMFDAVMRSQITTAHAAPDTWITGLTSAPWFTSGVFLLDNMYQPVGPVNGAQMVALAGTPHNGSPLMPGSDIPSVAMTSNMVVSQQGGTQGGFAPTTFIVSFRVTKTAGNGTWVVVVRQTATTTSTLVETLRVTTGGALQFTVYNSSGASPVTATVAAPAGGGRFDDGRLVCCICIVKADHVELWVPSDGGAGTTTHASSGALTYSLSAGLTQFGTNGAQDEFEVGEFAAWNTVQTGMEDLIGAAVGRQAAWPFNLSPLATGDLVPAFCRAAKGLSPGTQTLSLFFDAGAGVTGWPSDKGLPSNLGDAVRQLGTGAFGAAYVGRGAGPGYTGLLIRDWAAFANAPARFTDPVAQLTDDPAASGLPPVVRVIGRGRAGPLHNLLVSLVRHTVRDLATGQEGTYTKRAAYTPPASVPAYVTDRRFGERSVDSPYVTGLAWLDNGALSALQGQPQIEIGDLTIAPWGDDKATQFVLHDLDLEKAVTYSERPRPYSESTARVSGTFRVIGETWNWQQGLDWTVTLRIAP